MMADARPLPQQSSQYVDNPLHYVPYYINEAQRQLIAQDAAIRRLQSELAQKEKQRLAEKSELETQLVSMQHTYVEEKRHISEPSSSPGRAVTPAPRASDGHSADQRCIELEAALRSLREEGRAIAERHQAEQDEWSATLASLSHRCDTLQSALKGLGYELRASGELRRCAPSRAK